MTKKLFLPVFCLLIASSAWAQEPVPAARTLQDLTAEWVALEQTLGAEKRDWKEQKAFLANEIDLLKKEKEALTKEIAEAERSENAFLKEKAALIEDREDFQKTLGSADPQILRAAEIVNQWKKKIPSALSENYEKLLNELRYAASDSASRRLQAVFALVAEFESLQSGFHVTREYLVLDGEEREFEVLYTGLARAFAVSMDGKRAAVGSPGDEGWTWNRSDKLAGRIREALTYQKKEKAAEFVSLPFRISGGEL